MDQVKNNSATLDLLQAIAAQNQLPKTGSKGDSDFRKMMDKAASGKDAKPEEAPKAETPTQGKTEEAPVETRESSLERIKKLLEQDIQRETDKLEELRRKEEKKRQEVVDAKIDTSSIEKLKEHKLEDYNKAVQKDEEKLIDEFVSSAQARANIGA